MLLATFASDVNDVFFAIVSMLACLSYFTYRFANRNRKAATGIGKFVVSLLIRRYLGK